MNTYAKPGGEGGPYVLAREFEAGLEKSRELGTCAILRQALLVEVLQLPSSGSFRMTEFTEREGKWLSGRCWWG